MATKTPSPRSIIYRSLPNDVGLPADQRWRVIELDGDLAQLTDVPTIIKKIGDIPPGTTVYLVDPAKLDSWTIALTVTKS